MLKNYYITLQPSVVSHKKGRTLGKAYLVISHPSAEKVEFINDDNEFDAVDKYLCRFSHLHGDPAPVVPKPEKPTEQTLLEEAPKEKKGPFGRPLKETK